MGDRITTYPPCPKCGKKSEQYSAYSCLQWSWHCEHCGWKDDRDYYETDENTIGLMTEKEARERKVIFDCPVCKETMTWWEKDKYKMCSECEQDKRLKIKEGKGL